VLDFKKGGTNRGRNDPVCGQRTALVRDDCLLPIADGFPSVGYNIFLPHRPFFFLLRIDLSLQAGHKTTTGVPVGRRADPCYHLSREILLRCSRNSDFARSSDTRNC